MKTIYYTPKDDPSVTKSYLVEDIDAADAVRRHPDEYSYTAKPKATVVEVPTVYSAMAAGDPIPMTGTDNTPAPVAAAAPPAAAAPAAS